MSPLFVARVAFAVACLSGLLLATMHYGVTGAVAAIMVIAVISFILAWQEL